MRLDFGGSVRLYKGTHPGPVNRLTNPNKVGFGVFCYGNYDIIRNPDKFLVVPFVFPPNPKP